MADDYHCRKCSDPVEKGQSRCPHCGYKATWARYSAGPRRRYWTFAKWTFYLTIIGIPLGRWYAKKQRRAERDAEFGVAEPPYN